MSLPSVLILALVLSSGVIAYRNGGPPEKLAAAIIVGWIAAHTVRYLLAGPATYIEVDPFHLTLDTIELLAITLLALRANRVWPLFAAAAQLICVIGHVSAIIEPGGMRRAYWAITQLPQYIQLTALLLGTVAHTRRERRRGAYRSWRFS